jgi:hypothetical protein
MESVSGSKVRSLFRDWDIYGDLARILGEFEMKVAK